MADTKVVEVDGLRYVYVVESGEIYGEDPAASDPAEGGDDQPRQPTEEDIRKRAAAVAPPPGRFQSEKVSLRTLSMSVIGECNLGCTYCYVFEDHTPTPAALKMSEAEALRQVDFFVDQAGDDVQRLTFTFFGGEPFLNFPVLKSVARYAREKGAAGGKDIGFTITTNGTLLTPDAVDFLWEYDVQTTISLDGDREQNDARRGWVGKDEGSYDHIVPRLKGLLERFRDRPWKIGARATLTHGNTDVERVVTHLLGLGFWEVSASVATIDTPGLAFTREDYAEFNAGLARLADRFVDASLRNQRFGFTNVASLVKRFHEGSVRDYPCGATIGLVGSDPQGNLYVCHRFVGDERYKVGSVTDGVDHDHRNGFIRSQSVRMKDYCSPCWLRHLCGGGCYHEAMVSGADDFSKLEAVCDDLRSFYEVCLRAYVRIATGNPEFLTRLDPQIRKEIDEGASLPRPS